jgi:small subunit ribosomal protein S20
MPISLSAKKSLRKSVKNNRDNVLFKTKLKLTVKKFLAKPSIEVLKNVYSLLDKAVKNGIYHKNKVARLKSNYSKKVKSDVQTKSVAKKKVIKKSK